MDQLQFFVPTLFGLEGLAADELRRLSLTGVRAENGHVLCTGRPGDIHERDAEYLRRCIETGERAAAHYGWRRVALRKDGEIREIDEKHEEIFSIVRGAL